MTSELTTNGQISTAAALQAINRIEEHAAEIRRIGGWMTDAWMLDAIETLIPLARIGIERSDLP